MSRAILNALATLLISSTLLPTCGAQDRPAEVTRKVRAEPFARYTGNSLLDVSPDGRLILFFGASTPNREVRPSGVTEWMPQRGEQHFDMLRVVEWASGRELGSLHVHQPNFSYARFYEGGKKVCYRDERGRSMSWDYTSKALSAYPAELLDDAIRRSSHEYNSPDGVKRYKSPDGKFAAEPSREVVREKLWGTYKDVRGVVTIYDLGTGEQVGAALHPTLNEDTPLTGFVYRVGFTPDNRYLLTSYEGDTYIWRLNHADKK